MREVDRSIKASASSIPRGTVELEGVLLPGKANVRPLRVVLVEDDAFDRARCVQLLRGRADTRALEIIECSTLAEAVSSIEAEAPDCVFLDFTLPDGTGSEFLEQQRERGWDLEFPTVILSDREENELRPDPMSDGAADILTKKSLSSRDLGRALDLAMLKTQLLQFKRRIEHDRYSTRLRRLSAELEERFDPALTKMEKALEQVWGDLLVAAMANQGNPGLSFEDTFTHLAEARAAGEQIRRELESLHTEPAGRSEPPASRSTPFRS
jgi:CheY-like chemotaxis protein